MTPSCPEQLLSLLKFHLDAFAMCEIGRGAGLQCAAQQQVLVHFVLRGRGSIEWTDGRVDLAPGFIVIIPKNMPKTINGLGPISTIVDADEGCPLSQGIAQFKAGASQDCLVLGCASLDLSAMNGIGFFDQLTDPIAVQSSDATLPLLFEAILTELSNPAIGSKSIVEAAMSQIIVLMFRSELQEAGRPSQLLLSLEGSPGLGRAVQIMLKRPQDPHCVDDLARAAGMSRSRFSRNFTSRFGQSPHQYLRSMRLETAARLLENTEKPVKSIAAAVGFSSRSQFSSAFRGAFGTDPTSFRRQTALDA